MALLMALITLWGSTLGIVALDKSMRAKKARTADVPQFGEEPRWGVLAALTLIFNVAALPYYFYATRRSGAWGAIGFLAFLGCVTATYAVLFVVTLATVVAGPHP